MFELNDKLPVQGIKPQSLFPIKNEKKKVREKNPKKVFLNKGRKEKESREWCLQNEQKEDKNQAFVVTWRLVLSHFNIRYVRERERSTTFDLIFQIFYPDKTIC